MSAYAFISVEVGMHDRGRQENSPDQLKTPDEASAIELGFPYDLYAKPMPRAVWYGGMRDQILA